jgi:hypothetical protein
MVLRCPWPLVLFLVGALEGDAFAQPAPQPVCLPGTPVCAQSDGRGGVQLGAAAQGQVGPGGASGNAQGNANAGGAVDGRAQGSASARRSSGYSGRFGAGAAFCATLKAGVWSGYKVGPCFGVSLRTEHLYVEMETQLLFGGTRHSVDWAFPLSFVIPFSNERSLFEGLQLRAGGSPFGMTFAKKEDGGTYVRFGLHAGLSYEWLFTSYVAWRVFDARAFLDFGTKTEVDRLGNFIDFGGQLSTGLVF